MSHAEPGQLVDLARGVLAQSDAAFVHAHVEGCAQCHAVLERLSLLVRAAAPPASDLADAVRRVRALGPPAERRGPALVRARLVFDNLLQPLPAGIRGAAADRHIVFETDHWTVDLRLTPREHAVGITGQLMHALAMSQPCSDVAVVARSGEAVVGRTVTGAWGEFMLDCADPAALRLEILVPPPGIEIAVAPLAG